MSASYAELKQQLERLTNIYEAYIYKDPQLTNNPNNPNSPSKAVPLSGLGGGVTSSDKNQDNPGGGVDTVQSQVYNPNNPDNPDSPDSPDHPSIQIHYLDSLSDIYIYIYRYRERLVYN